MDKFAGPSVVVSVTLPEDMHKYLKLKKEREGIPVSVQVRKALEAAIFADVESRHAPTLVDPGEEYVTQPAPVEA